MPYCWIYTSLSSDVSRIDAGMLQLEFSTVPIATMLTECCAVIEPLAKERGILIEDNFASIGNLKVQAEQVDTINTEYNKTSLNIALLEDEPSDARILNIVSRLETPRSFR